MSRVIILAICFCAVFKPDASISDEPQLPGVPKDYAQILLPQLPPGWRCSYDFRTLVISHDEHVSFFSRLGVRTLESNDAKNERFGVHAPYLIVMKFVSRLSEPDQLALVERRRQAVNAARKGREREKYTGADVYSQHFVPKYFNDRFSIDLQTSDSWPLELIEPKAVVKQRDAILKLLHANLHAYPVQQ